MGMSFQKRSAEGVSPGLVFWLSLLFVFPALAALYESCHCRSACIRDPIAISAPSSRSGCVEWKITSPPPNRPGHALGLARKPILMSNSPRPNTKKANLGSTPRSQARVCAFPRSYTSWLHLPGFCRLVRQRLVAVARRILGQPLRRRRASAIASPDSGNVLRREKLAARRKSPPSPIATSGICRATTRR